MKSDKLDHVKREKFDYDELREYIDAFKTSSDRARYALYFVIVATILIGISNNNIQNSSWPLRRLDTWYNLYKKANRQNQTPDQTQNQTANTPGSPVASQAPVGSNIPTTIARG